MLPEKLQVMSSTAKKHTHTGKNVQGGTLKEEGGVGYIRQLISSLHVRAHAWLHTHTPTPTMVC